MSFTPVVPFTGFSGWAFLNRTLEAQKAAFAKNPETVRDAAYFREKIGQVTTAADLVADRRLLKVALGAFGLDADLPNKAFIRRVLEDGTLSTGALANRLADKRYMELSRAFGFGDYPTPSTQISDFADKILARYAAKSFEAAVGTQNADLRLALGARSELAALAARPGTDDTKWYSILGSKPLRQVFQTAFGLPPSFALVDVDRQRDVLKQKSGALLDIASPAGFADPAKVESLIRLFLARAEAPNAPGAASGSAALRLLATGQAALSRTLGRG
ncbi:MAG: DUF1217 domain-containing protein [Paracoccaceae bacterium]